LVARGEETARARFHEAQFQFIMPEELNILLVEDVVADANAVEEELRRGGLRCRTRRVRTREEFEQAIKSGSFHVILSDFTLPAFDGLSALRLLRAKNSGVPFILVTSPRSEEVAMECLREGATDYVLKSSLRRLPSAITAALARQTAERARAKAERTLRSLPRFILEAQEAERRRVARDLHDSVNQILSSAKFRIEALAERFANCDPDALREILKTREILAHAITEVRRISRNLRPSELDDLGLLAAIRSLAGEFGERSGIKLQLQLSDAPGELPDDVELNIYRIVQEALANVERHAHARNVNLAIETVRRRLRVSVRDDGAGFVPGGAPQAATDGPCMGLVDMRERATHLGGHCEIHSELGHGTEIIIEVPLPPSSSPPHANRKKRNAGEDSVAAGR
jgi:signal transduction histidine kinase